MLFSDDWADEMQIEGFVLLDENEANEERAALEELEFPLTVYFGTNEENEYESMEQLAEAYKLEPITGEEYEVMFKLFGPSFGNISPYTDLL